VLQLSNSGFCLEEASLMTVSASVVEEARLGSVSASVVEETTVI
jgi:hypothetical protein